MSTCGAKKGRDHGLSQESKGDIASTGTNKRKGTKRVPRPNTVAQSDALVYLADFATLMHTTVHRLSFQWTNQEDKAYQALKVMLSEALVV